MTRTRTRLHRLTAVLAALALSLSGLAAATPARAQTDDLARFVIGATTLFIIGKAIEGSQRDRYRPPAYQPPAYQPPAYGPDPSHRAERRRAPRYLPAECEIRIGRGGGSYFPEACLRRAGVVAGLPERCAVRIEGRRRDRIAYEGDCLRRSGFDDGGHGRRRY
jgi:hypothetical protein